MLYLRALSFAAWLLTSSLIVVRAAPAQPHQKSLADIFASEKHSVVFIVAATGEGAQSGSGFILKSDANSSTIVTANHVIEGASQVDVIIDSDPPERYLAQVVNYDHVRDVAILKINSGHRATLALEPSPDIQEGMPIAVVGYPRATLQFFKKIEGDALRPSIHSGIVSAVRLNGEIIQFDAAVDHGDSGGPIIDASNGKVIAIVRGSPLDPSYAARGLEQALPGSAFGPSTATIREVVAGTHTGPTTAVAADPMAINGSMAPSSASMPTVNSASFRVGYGIPHDTTLSSEPQNGEIDEAVDASVLSRLVDGLKASNDLYLIPLQLSSDAVKDSQHLVGYCEDNRLNAIAAPAYDWRLTGGPRYNGYGVLVGYSGAAEVAMRFVVADCFGMPFFYGQKTKTENRYFAHRAPDREIVDMANDVLDQLMADFNGEKTARAGAWHALLQTGLAIDPNDSSYHSMLYFAKKPEGYQVVVVAPRGPADRAGLRVQDVILRINDVDASSMSIDQLKHYMDAEQYTLQVQRPEGVVTLTVRPLRYADLVRILQH